MTGPGVPRPWSSRLAIGLLVLASPLLLAVAWFVLVDWPWDVGIGVAAAFSNHDVIQTADAEETGVSLVLLCIAVFGLCWLMRLRPSERVLWRSLLYGPFLCIPVIVLLGMGTEAVLQKVLAIRGYRYCTYHLLSNDKGGSGTYVYVRTGAPESCAAARAVFPDGTVVPGRREPFDLPPR